MTRTEAFIKEKLKLARNEKWEKQLEAFGGSFRRAQILKLERVTY